jgi:hypothetical protein
MTVGALSLMMLETAPVDEAHATMTAISSLPVSDDKIVFHTHVPVNREKWRNVVVRKAPSADHSVAKSCHFIVSDETQAVTTTELWKNQADGYHTFAPGDDWNSDSIGVCFVGELDDHALGARKFSELMLLVRTLQHHFAVSPDRVYFHSELDDRTIRPSGPFVRAFSDRLIQ